jgi:hypothetical protein
MAKQVRWQRRATYVIEGPTGNRRKVKFITKFSAGGYTLVVFRFLRPAK